MIGSPLERFIQVTEVTGVGLAVGEFGGNFGDSNLMRAYGRQKGIRGVWHMAVVAGTADRTRLVIRVLSQPVVIFESGMACQAGFVSGSVRFQQVIGPGLAVAQIIPVLVKRVTIQTGKIFTVDAR